MATPTSPTDMEVSECEPASCSATTSTATTSFASMMATPTSLVSMTSMGTDEDDEEEEAMIVSGYGAAASGEPASMEQEFEALDENNGWPQAFLKVANQCHDYLYRVARALENRSRNRSRDVSPYDHSRVCLKMATPAPGGGFHPGLGFALAGAAGSGSFASTSSSTGDRGGGGDVHNDYINASFVVVKEAQRCYILTQGPLPNTSSHFWLMAWQQNSPAVIMLNRLVEKNIVKCSLYWPLSQGQTLRFDDMGISVHMVGEEVKPYYTVHYLRLENMLTGEAKAISHFHYTGWPDFGVPESPASFLTFLFMIRESGSLNYEKRPVIIHCSAGIGRSGTFALVDACLVLMEKKEKPFSLNIREVLVNMRKYRMGLIQTPEQLRFSYLAIIEGAKFLMGDENIKKKWKELSKEDHARSYSFDTPPPPSGKALQLVLGCGSDDDDDDDTDDDDLDYLAKDDDDDDDYDDDDDDNDEESDCSDLATRMPDSGEQSSECGARKRGREDCKASTSQEEENQSSERPAKRVFKRKNFNVEDM